MQRRAALLTIRPRPVDVRAVADAVETPEGETLVIDSLANDIGPGKTLLAVGAASSGSAVLGSGVAAGKIIYTPAAGFSGTATFTYTMISAGRVRSATVTVTVTPAPPPPPPSTAVLTGVASGLRWASGGYSKLAELETLRTNPDGGLVRRLDVVRIFSYPGPPACTSGDTMVSRHSSAILAARGRGTRYLSFASRPFAAGSSGNAIPGLPKGSSASGHTLMSWPAKGSLPADKWISPRFPVGYQSSGVSSAQKQQQAMDVWGHAADGHWDHIWAAQIQDIKTKLLVNKGWGSDCVWIECPWWECNKEWVYGSDHGLFGGSYACCQTQADVAVVRAALDRRCDVTREAWGSNPAHPKVLMHFNPHKDSALNTAVIKVQDFMNPAKWDLVGPDWYDRNVTGTGLARWNALNNKAPNGSLSGLASWAAWIRQQHAAGHTHLRLGIGEWGNVYEPGGPYNPGGDNPVFVEEFVKFFENNRDICDGGYEAHFNTGSHLLTAPGGGTEMPNASARYALKLGNRV